MRQIWLMSVVLFLVAGCTGTSTNSTSSVSTASTSTAEMVSAALGATPLWSQSETVAPGLVLDPLGPIDPGVAVDVEMLPSTPAVTMGLEGARIVVDSCRTVAPGQWVIEGTVAVPGDETVSGALGVEVGASDTFSTEYLGVTFAGSGTFALGFERQALSTGKLDNGALWWENEVSLTNCRLVTATTAGGFVTIEHFEDLPGWEATDGTVQSYALDVANSSRGGLGWSLGVDVWLGIAYPFGELWLPDDPTLFGPISSSNQPSCASTTYSLNKGDVRVADVTHFAGTCHGDPATLGAVEGAAGWEWVETSGTAVTARRSRDDGGLEVRAVDRDTVIEVIDQLHPYRNLLAGEPVGASTLDGAVETAMAAQLEGGDPVRNLVERGRVPIESGAVVVLTAVTVRNCDGCTDRPEWYALVVRERSGRWDASVLGGGEWDQCLAISYGGSDDRGFDMVAITGEPTWTIESLVDDEWEPVDTIDGLWAIVGAPDSGLPVIRAVDETGEPQPCALTETLGG